MSVRFSFRAPLQRLGENKKTKKHTVMFVYVKIVNFIKNLLKQLMSNLKYLAQLKTK
jgi:hypothetical protein